MTQSARSRSILTLFTAGDSVQCHRVRMVLAAKGVAYDRVEVAPGKPSEELLELNPYGDVPTLLDRDLLLYEFEAAICRLAEKTWLATRKTERIGHTVVLKLKTAQFRILTRSPLEERFAPFLRRHRLRLPRFNDWIVVNGRRFQVDCHWPDVREIVELDGWEGHGTRSACRDDRARDRALRVAGYSVTRLTWAQLEDEPAAIAADLRSLLAPSR